MIDRRKKYKVQTDVPNLHIGNVLKAYFTNNKINRAALCRKLDITDTGMNRYLKQESVQFGILRKIALATNYNFLAYTGEQTPVEYISKKELELQKLLQEKEEELKMMTAELAVYKRILER